MDLRKKCLSVERVFEELDRLICAYKNKNKIDCLPECKGECCKKEDLYTTVLEFLPLAFFLHSEGISEKIFAESELNRDSTCVLYSEETGKCLFYRHRGLICRLFGFSSIKDKNNRLQMVTCRWIKSAYKDSVVLNPSNIIMLDYQRRLSLIDTTYGTKLTHVNKSIKTAIELVGMYLKYNRI
ncbi:MAG: YkgJ family cysteine cluster protein [Deltaproteobacteria bacterium]|nr:YkgJ family cysteine cluster protein [Deltaproteobacteria bacterium]